MILLLIVANDIVYKLYIYIYFVNRNTYFVLYDCSAMTVEYIC